MPIGSSRTFPGPPMIRMCWPSAAPPFRYKTRAEPMAAKASGTTETSDTAEPAAAASVQSSPRQTTSMACSIKNCFITNAAFPMCPSLRSQATTSTPPLKPASWGRSTLADGSIVMSQCFPSRWKHWDITGGTSIATPCWAGLIAIANQMRGKPVGFIQPALYRLRGKGMHDITSGNNSYGGVTGYSAQPGYDLASGWGTPIANQFVPDLIEALDNPDYGCPGYRTPCG